jgi:hypothetical protein
MGVVIASVTTLRKYFRFTRKYVQSLVSFLVFFTLANGITTRKCSFFLTQLRAVPFSSQVIRAMNTKVARIQIRVHPHRIHPKLQKIAAQESGSQIWSAKMDAATLMITIWVGIRSQ